MSLRASPFISTYERTLELWLDNSKTLRAQEVTERSVVQLRRKYFYSDVILDTGDTVQLDILYAQVLVL